MRFSWIHLLVILALIFVAWQLWKHRASIANNFHV